MDIVLGIDAPKVPGYGQLTLFNRGSQGTLWKSEHLATKRVDAIKITPAASADPAGIARAKREAILLAKFSGSPNLVSVYGAGTLPNGDFWLSMEFIDGVTLHDEVTAKGPLPLPRVKNLAQGIADGFAAMHAIGALHRDGKPPNIMVRSGTDTAVVIDLAAARPIESSLTRVHDQMFPFSPAWGAPELHQGAEATVQSEIWAITAMLYFMLVGRKPFEGNIATVMDRIQNTDPEMPSVLRPEIGASMDDLIKQGLAKQPYDRFATVAEWIDALNRAIPTSAEDHTVIVPKSGTVFAHPGMLKSRYDIGIPRWQVVMREFFWD